MTHDDPQHTEPEERDDAVIGRAFRGSIFVIAAIVLVGGSTAYWLSRPAPAPPTHETELATVEHRALSPVEPPVVPFEDVTDQVGIDFVHNNGASGDKLLPETMGGGCAALDFDNDGDQDLLLVNSKSWPWDAAAGEQPSEMGLYENTGGTFRDVTAGSGLDVSFYGMGPAVGDYDNDGLVDVFLTAVGANHLFRNTGNGTFEEVTESAGVAGGPDQWSTSAGWFDYDNDGDLDLFVCNYLKWTKQYDQAQDFQLVGGGRAYGRPQNFEGTFPYLYRNDGSGKFTDVSASAGIQIRNRLTDVPLAKSLGVTFADLNEDGYLDILVANDTVQNLLFRNTGDGTFKEYGVFAGVAFDASGNARGAMGIDVSSIRNNQSTGIAIGNFSNEMTALYVSRRGQLQFSDEAISTGLGPNTRQELTFGIFYFDYDLDGRADLFCSNGHLEEDINRVQPSQHYAQPPQLFWNAGMRYDTEFVPLDSEHCGEDLLEPIVGRGAAYLDFDSDGDLDILISACGGAPRLLRNELALDRHWVRIKLVGDGQRCNRDAIGSWVEVTAGDRKLRKQVMPTRSYISQVELPLTFGLGDSSTIDKVTVHWADGSVQELGSIAVNRQHTITQDSSQDPSD